MPHPDDIPRARGKIALISSRTWNLLRDVIAAGWPEPGQGLAVTQLAKGRQLRIANRLDKMTEIDVVVGVDSISCSHGPGSGGGTGTDCSVTIVVTKQKIKIPEKWLVGATFTESTSSP